MLKEIRAVLQFVRDIFRSPEEKFRDAYLANERLRDRVPAYFKRKGVSERISDKKAVHLYDLKKTSAKNAEAIANFKSTGDFNYLRQLNYEEHLWGFKFQDEVFLLKETIRYVNCKRGNLNAICYDYDLLDTAAFTTLGLNKKKADIEAAKRLRAEMHRKAEMLEADEIAKATAYFNQVHADEIEVLRAKGMTPEELAIYRDHKIREIRAEQVRKERAKAEDAWHIEVVPRKSLEEIFSERKTNLDSNRKRHIPLLPLD